MDRLCIALVLLLSISNAYSESITDAPDNSIKWYKPDFPPLNIVSGPYAGMGYSDKLETYLIDNLSHYQHQELVSPFKRTLRDMKKGLNICSVTLLKKPEREEFVIFSKPARLLLPNSLVVRKQDAVKMEAFLNSQQKVSLEEVIQSGQFRIGYSDGRSYTKPIDRLLKTYKESDVLVGRVGKDNGKGLVSMLAKGHVDIVIQQPVEADFNARLIGSENSYITYPIAEISSYTVGYIGCSKTPWGEQVIERVNALIDFAVTQHEFRGFYEEFLDEASKARYREVYDEFFKLGSFKEAN